MHLIDYFPLVERACALAKSDKVLSNSFKKGERYARMILIDKMLKTLDIKQIAFLTNLKPSIIYGLQKNYNSKVTDPDLQKMKELFDSKDISNEDIKLFTIDFEERIRQNKITRELKYKMRDFLSDKKKEKKERIAVEKPYVAPIIVKRPIIKRTITNREICIVLRKDPKHELNFKAVPSWNTKDWKQFEQIKNGQF